MRIEDTFVISAPAQEVYAALLDVERIAPCVPGADGVEPLGDDAYRARVRVKVGPITMQYRADIAIVDRDPQALRATLRVRAKESRGQGGAEAVAELSLAEVGGRTEGRIGVDVALSGRVASMGQGVIADVSARMVAAFAANLEALLGTAPAPDAAAAPQAESGIAPPPSPPQPQPVAVAAVAGAVLRERARRAPRARGVWPVLLAIGLFAAGYVAGRRRA
ncbi:MAG TPA: SRPBCC family protein [Baekduia sp.]